MDDDGLSQECADQLLVVMGQTQGLRVAKLLSEADH